MTTAGKTLPAPADFSDVRPAENSFRWWVRSRTNPRKEYLADISSYGRNGKCTCKDFEVRFEKFLTRAMTPAEAFAMFPQELELRPYMLGVDDILRCWHLCRARSRLADGFIEMTVAAQNAQAPAR